MNKKTIAILSVVLVTLLILGAVAVNVAASQQRSTPRVSWTTKATTTSHAVPARPSSRASQPSPTRIKATDGAVAVSELPREAQDTLRLIDAGGPFPYPRNDGAVFSNAEGHLPRQARGYYHEYTVYTPGSRDRGARRIVTGGQGERYYTDDHYRTFVRIAR